MTDAARRYQELLLELLLERALAVLAGGELAQNHEARFVADLDRCWQAMTDEEQEQAERRLAERSVPSAPAELAQEDLAVGVGSRDGPRKAA
jgi:hypothetical protein